MGLFSKKKNVIKRKSQLTGSSHRSHRRITDNDNYVSEFREGIGEINNLFSSDDSADDKFAQLVFGLANFNKYRNIVYTELVDEKEMSSRDANKMLRDIIDEAGLYEMMMNIVNFRESKKRRRK